MHQPNYRDPIQSFYSMPWVRLHSSKAYYDMAYLAEKYPEMGLTFNLVPALLEQIEDYTDGAEDFDLILSGKDPAYLTSDEKEAMLSRFFQANQDTMIKPLPRYVELLQYRGVHGSRSGIEAAVKKFAAQDYLDLQVLYNLSWFGFSQHDNNEDIRKLINKGRFFTTEDRDLVLQCQHDCIARLIPYYRDLWKKGSIDISTSPFYHPILPLLCDTSSALEGMPGTPLPKKRYQYPEDAVKQVEMGIRYCKQKLGKKPKGMWPSEGSVSPEALEIIRAAGIQWVATDENILARSTSNFNRNRDLYHPWDINGLSVFFRDFRLSDQIGFVYARNPADTAADDFIDRLRSIASAGKDTERCVSVILDGENAWETYPNSGKAFLSKLYERILSEKDLQPIQFSRYLEEHPPEKKISKIFPGSWINANFDTWIGEQEENDGWDALKNARDMLVKHQDALSKKDAEEAWLEIYRAEGSDWFWWYGTDHSSPNDPEFDRLFRAHLERVYQILNREIPQEIREPIIRKMTLHADVEPSGFISPVIDGRMTTFYEWQSAGWFPAIGPEGAMSGGELLVSDVYYGYDLQLLYFRFDLVQTEEPAELSKWSLSIILQNSETYRVDIPFENPDSYVLLRKVNSKWVRRTRKKSVSAGRIIEVGIPFKDLNMQSGDKSSFSIIVYENRMERERLPRVGTISFVVPDKNFQSLMWQL